MKIWENHWKIQELKENSLENLKFIKRKFGKNCGKPQKVEWKIWGNFGKLLGKFKITILAENW